MSDAIGLLLEDTARLYRRDFNSRARHTGVTVLQWRLLTHIDRNPGIRQRDLAELIEVEPITLSRMVDRLTKTDLVERRNDPQDRRAWCLYLTERARALLAGAQQMIAEQANIATEGFSAEERALLSRLVDVVRSNLSRRV